MSKGCNFKILTGNHFLKIVLTTSICTGLEARFLELFATLELFLLLKTSDIHVIGENLPRAPHASANILEISNVYF